MEYMATFKIQEDVSETERVENTIQTTAPRYSKKLQESIIQTRLTDKDPNDGQNTVCSQGKKTSAKLHN
jgi:hypothetical protein